MQIQQVIVTGKNEVELRSLELETGNLTPDSVLIETERSFISAGTELAIYTATDADVYKEGAWCSYPYRAGYANVGVVREAGERHRHLLGKRVFSFGNHASAFVYTSDSHRRLMVPVPDELSSREAAAARMAQVAMSGLDVSAPRYVRWVVIIGLGMVGNLAAQLFHLTGAQVIGVDPAAHRRALAQECGIRHVLGGSEEEVAEGVRRITGGRMANVAVDAVGHSAVCMQALRLVATGGELIVLGTPRVSMEGPLTEVFVTAHRRWVTIKGSLEWNIPDMSPRPQDYTLATRTEGILGWLADGRLRLQTLLTHDLPPTEIKQAYEGLLNRKEEYVGVTLNWSGS